MALTAASLASLLSACAASHPDDRSAATTSINTQSVRQADAYEAYAGTDQAGTVLLFTVPGGDTCGSTA